MRKKLSLLIILIITTFMLTGCSALFFDTYYSEEDFQGNQSIDLDSDVQMVHSYAELRRLVFNLMNNHEESIALRFAGYSGNVVSDIASVCNAVKTENAYGAYCVDYVSYDLTQIVSYYEATINISYQYTAEELAQLKTTNNHENFSVLLADELTQKASEVLVKVNNGTSDHGTVVELIEKTIREHPLSMSYFPEFSVRIFSGNSSQKIYAINIVYNENMDNDKRVDELRDSIQMLTATLDGENDALKLISIAERMKGEFSFDVTAGNTAYDALIEKLANSEGVASAFKALCDQIGVECLIVDGKLDREEHFWNIVKVENQYYHFDMSALNEQSAMASLFRSDTDQQVNYWWDQSIYPDCVGELTYLSVSQT